ncbi:MAG TPA: RNA methyltransferase [bacterium]|nr:RNA methyltransferase [bacterium]
MKNTQRRELAVCGLETVRALVAVRPDAVRRFFYTEDRAREFGSLCSRLAALKRPYRLVAPAELERLSGTAHHQGLVAMMDDAPPPQVTDALVDQWVAVKARVVVLDRVGDDHNLGSIARSAAFFGWQALVIGRDDGGARLTTSAYRVARGALERIPVYTDESAARFVSRCGRRIMTIGADHRASRSIRKSAVPDGAVALVLGNEETGLSSDVRASCAELVRIDGAGTVESMNVSQAAAVFLYELAPIGR